MPTTVRAAPAPVVSPAPARLVQRCGGAKCPEGTCDHKGNRLRRSAAGPAPALAPPAVNQALRAPGQPLDAATRAFMEPRLGHDFGNVRVHTGGEAASSARAVGARAYTVGSDVVLGPGGYQPGSSEGRRLLAHELVHVMQNARGGGGGMATSLEVGAPDTAQERQADAIAATIESGGSPAPAAPLASAAPVIQRACGSVAIGTVGGCTGRGGDAAGEPFLFKKGCDELKPGEEARLRAFAATISSTDTVEVDGFASLDGDATFNENLSCARAWTAWLVLTSEGVPFGNITLFMHGETPGPVDERRSVVVNRITAAPPTPEPEEPEEPARPTHICGPDVTTELENAMASLRSSFAGLSSSQKDDSCDALDSVFSGALTSWDVTELHNNAWIHRDYRPACATAGATPPCGSSVQVGNDCWYAGSPNYVTFGVACKLCAGHHAGTSDASRFTEAEMLDIIDLYKGTGPLGISTPSANFRESQLWARAGYRGWPAGGNPTGGDRNNCSPTCPTPHTSPSFNPRWCPHIDPLSMC